MQRSHIVKALFVATAILVIPGALRSERVDLKTAVETAMQTHPEINQAVENKTAIEFEREQAQGMFLPRVSVEGSVGIRRLENATRKSLACGRGRGSVVGEHSLIMNEVRTSGKICDRCLGACDGATRGLCSKAVGSALCV